MINDNILLFIISIVLIYVFDHKILPTIGVIAFTLIELYIMIVINLPTITQIDAFYAFLFVISLMYGTFMIFAGSTEMDESRDLIL